MTLPYNIRDYHFRNRIDVDTKCLRLTLDWNKTAKFRITSDIVLPPIAMNTVLNKKIIQALLIV